MAQPTDEQSTEPKTVTVSCDFCTEKFSCAEDLLDKGKKNMCYSCFENSELSDEELNQLNVNVPEDKVPEVTANGVAQDLVTSAFPLLWAERKEKLKESSKKELAEEMFRAGVFIGVKSCMQSMNELDEEAEEKKE